jgi:hypothetical protein
MNLFPDADFCISRDDLDVVNAYSEDRVPPLTFPARPYLATGPLLCKPRTVAVRVTASDQAWGNTGHSYIYLQIANGNSTYGRVLNILYHSKSTYETTLNEEDLSATGRGTTISVVSVSAPYPGYESKVFSASILVRYSRRYDMAIIKAQVNRVPRPLAKQIFDIHNGVLNALLPSIFPGSVSKSEQRAFAFLFIECDDLLFSRVVKYIFP